MTIILILIKFKMILFIDHLIFFIS